MFYLLKLLLQLTLLPKNLQQNHHGHTLQPLLKSLAWQEVIAL